MAIYAVGDIQGCLRPLQTLLRSVSFDPAVDRLWCVGDLVNRGPDSLAVLRYLKSLGDACVCVLGNHDLHLLELVSGGLTYHRDSLGEVLMSDDRDELVEWLRFRPLLHHDEEIGWCMVHAGLHPDWTLKKAKKRAAMVEMQLQGEQWQSFCRSLHHAEFPKREPKKEDAKRAMFAAAVLTRTRYCTSDGQFNWEVRAGASSNRRDRPWFNHRELAWKRDARIVYGHWAAMGLVRNRRYVLGLDSGCVWGGEMTLAELKPGRKFRIVATAQL